MKEDIFPSIKRPIQDFINDEEATIPRGKLLAVGSLMVVLSVILSVDAAAKHTSHKSHSSHSSSSYHRSHVSHTSHRSGHGSHSSHSNTHSSHSSHSNTHSSHSSHSNTSHTSHSSAVATSTVKPAVTTAQPVETAPVKPAVSTISAPADIVEISTSEISSNSIAAKLNSMGAPAGASETSGLTSALSMPLPTPEFTADSSRIQTPLDPPKVDKN